MGETSCWRQVSRCGRGLVRAQPVGARAGAQRGGSAPVARVARVVAAGASVHGARRPAVPGVSLFLSRCLRGPRCGSSGADPRGGAGGRRLQRQPWTRCAASPLAAELVLRRPGSARSRSSRGRRRGRAGRASGSRERAVRAGIPGRCVLLPGRRRRCGRVHPSTSVSSCSRATRRLPALSARPGVGATRAVLSRSAPGPRGPVTRAVLSPSDPWGRCDLRAVLQ